jgi:ubiquinol-cytochrome c reductase cytochrome b subunit
VTSVAQRTGRWFDDRLGGARWLRSAMRHVFPDHFSFMFGEIAFYSFVVLVATGVFLTLFFEPSAAETVYQGEYVPLVGLRVSEAYASVLHISFDVPMGLVIRQMHHWAALVFVLAIVLHLCRIFFTGAFRRPRDLNWLIGVTLLLLSMMNGFFGYSLLDDLLSGTGLRIAFSIAESIPVVGLWVAYLFFGGEFPAHSMIPRMFVLHVLVLPAAIAGLLAVHLALVWRQKHTQFPGPLASERSVVGSRLWPSYTARSTSLMLGIVAVLAALGGLAQINPIWLWGPYEPFAVTTGAQPDWYVGWLEGSLRLFPAWEITLFDHTVPALFFSGALLPAVTFGALYAYPFVERRLTGDTAEHEVLERPRDRPLRVGFGAAVLTFYVVLLVAGGQDVFAAWLGITIRHVVIGLRVALLVLPVAVGAVAWKWATDLRAIERAPSTETEIIDRAVTG